MNRKICYLLSLVMILGVLLSACATQPAANDGASSTVPPTAVPAVEKATTAPTQAPSGEQKLILATTTSTQDCGLLDYLLPMFTKDTGIKVDVIAVGTGQAIQLGKDGNADVLLVHARAQEDAFMASGDGTRREDAMYNDFVILGPASDPAKIKGMNDAVAAFKTIADKKSTFISRGDKSGTNTKELAIWKSANITPEGSWYVAAGQGMGEVLTMADEQQAYTLSDRATYLARTKKGLKLEIMVEKDKTLLNPYGVIAVNPNKSPNIHTDLAARFIDWIISVPVQEKIAEFGKADFGQSLFIPDSTLWKNR